MRDTRLSAVGPGRNVDAVGSYQVNADGFGHGGTIVTLADSDFVFASHSHQRCCVSAQNAITFAAPGRVGDRLCAMAVKVVLAGWSAMCDVTVTNQESAVFAVLRGNARAVGGAQVEED